MCLLPELSITVNMEPPPMPILCGFMTEVHRSAAMAPSTAEPPLRRISLQDITHVRIYLDRLHVPARYEMACLLFA